MRRAAVSVPANIVEGCARETAKEYRNFLNMAFGAVREVGYYVGLARRLGYLAEPAASELTDRYEECARVLSGLVRSVRTGSSA